MVKKPLNPAHFGYVPATTLKYTAQHTPLAVEGSPRGTLTMRMTKMWSMSKPRVTGTVFHDTFRSSH